MGVFTSKIEQNKINYMALSDSKNNQYDSNNNDVIIKYMKYCNDHGFIKIKLNLKNLSNFLLDISNKMNIDGLPSEIINKNPFITSFKNDILYDTNNIGFFYKGHLFFAIKVNPL